MTIHDRLMKLRPKTAQDEDTIRQGTERLTQLRLVLEWFSDGAPNSAVNQAADLLGMTPNDFKDQIAIEARRIMFVRSVK